MSALLAPALPWPRADGRLVERGDNLVESTKRVHVLACGVLAADLKAVAEKLGIDVSMGFLPGGLHNRPHELRRRLQEAIDAASAAQLGDLIAVGYGVCGLGSVGIHARNIPLAIPRVNDCIALFLGSDTAYKEQFAKYPGTYYISAGWVDERSTPQSQEAEKECGRRGPTDADFDQMVEKHGRENAEAVRYFLNSWQRNYQRAAFIDTGVSARRHKYAEIARSMAEGFGWKYEELAGTGELLTKLLTQRHSDSDILIVPPHHVTVYDATSKGLKAVPVWAREKAGPTGPQVEVFEGEETSAAGGRAVRLGLGIDAGGTYTDAVIYDFRRHAVVEKAKGLTTKWDFTIGIDEALDQLDAAHLAQVDLVSISTTLATNAIVEGRGQKAGLLIMPPYGLFDPEDIAYRPLAVLEGRLEIDGVELAPVNPDQVRRVVREMMAKECVEAFAVAGYASHNNPSHELKVKAIIREETGLSVTCGHEVSEGLNYRLRAATAALNARIIPCLEKLIGDVGISLGRRGVRAPVMVVKSDGSLMSVQTARQRPIETILSGPAASVAGASFLARLSNAMVVDIGGTTTDTAIIKDGVVRTCEEGAIVGGWRTHVRALDMRTLGLGGDSVVAWEKRELRIGPRRVAPVAWLAARQPHTMGALDWLERHLDYFDRSTGGMELVALNGRDGHEPRDNDEREIFDALHERPHSVQELAHRTGCVAWELLDLSRLEDRHAVQRCGLTPTDLLHVTGQVALWDADAARRISDLFARLLGLDRNKLADKVLRQVVRHLAVELFKKQLDEETDADEIDRSPVAQAMIRNALDGGRDGYRVRLKLHRPVIGIGAPVHLFLPQAAELLETEAVIPPHADVANAIGAITSSVVIHKQAKVVPNEAGGYDVYGLPDAPSFASFEDAHRHAAQELQKLVRRLAHEAGTSQTRVEVTAKDHIGELSDGAQLFVGRTLEARLSGQPDIARLARA